MALVIPPGYGQASIVWTGPLGTAPYVTTIGISLAGSEGDYVGAANLVFDAYYAAFGSTTNDALTLSRVTLLVGEAEGNGSVDSTNAPAQGGNGSSMAPIAMAPILRKQTSGLGRSGRGRMFLPGAVGETDVDDNGQLSSGFLSGLGTAAVQFLTDLQTGEVGAATYAPATPFLLHSSDSPDQTPNAIQNLVAVPTVGWIRKRLR